MDALQRGERLQLLLFFPEGLEHSRCIDGEKFPCTGGVGSREGEPGGGPVQVQLVCLGDL